MAKRAHVIFVRMGDEDRLQPVQLLDLDGAQLLGALLGPLPQFVERAVHVLVRRGPVDAHPLPDVAEGEPLLAQFQRFFEVMMTDVEHDERRHQRLVADGFTYREVWDTAVWAQPNVVVDTVRDGIAEALGAL